MRSGNQPSTDSIFIRKVIIVIALAGLALLLWRLRDMLLLIFGAVFVAIVFSALAAPLRRHLHLSGGMALGLAVLLLAAALGITSWLFGREVSAQVDSLIESLPAAWRSFEARIGDLAFGERLVSWARNAAPSGSGVMASAGTFMTSLGASVADTVLVVVGGIYFASQPTLYRDGLLKLLPRARREIARDALDGSGQALKDWLGGQLIAMTVVGVLVGAGLWALGVPLAFALGLIAGLLDFVPLVGPIVAAVPALLLALTVSPTVALWTALLFLVVQQIEGNILSPLVQQRAADLPPALLLFALLGFGSLFGVAGVIFAAPLTVVAYVMVKRLYVNEALDTPTETSAGDQS